MPQIGPLELVAVMVVALVVFGPERLPDMARKTGRMLNELRRMASDVKAEFTEGLNLDEDEEVGDEPERDYAQVPDDAGENDSKAAGDSPGQRPSGHPVAQALEADRSTTAAQESADQAGRPLEVSNKPPAPDEQ
ncbi:MAG: Sec-independent protein translocase protein TatB [Actinomycetota bacterium]